MAVLSAPRNLGEIIGLEAEVDFEALADEIPFSWQRINGSPPTAGIGTALGVGIVQHFFTGQVFMKRRDPYLFLVGGSVTLCVEKTGLIARGKVIRPAPDSEVAALFEKHPQLFQPGEWYEVGVD